METNKLLHFLENKLSEAILHKAVAINVWGAQTASATYDSEIKAYIDLRDLVLKELPRIEQLTTLKEI